MKKIFTLSAIAVLFSVLLVSCSKGGYGYGGGSDESYWLSKDRGEVVYSDSYCSYYTIEAYGRFSIVRAWNGYKPYEGAIIYGDLTYTGTKDMYNRSSGVVFTGTITDAGLTYQQAQDALDYYCPLKNGEARVFKKVTQ